MLVKAMQHKLEVAFQQRVMHCTPRHRGRMWKTRPPAPGVHVPCFWGWFNKVTLLTTPSHLLYHQKKSLDKVASSRIQLQEHGLYPWPINFITFWCLIYSPVARHHVNLFFSIVSPTCQAGFPINSQDSTAERRPIMRALAFISQASSLRPALG